MPDDHQPVSRCEQVLRALYAALKAGLPAGVALTRNEALPVRVPKGGWLCLRDGDPGQPEFLFSPPLYLYEHATELDIVIDAPPATREADFDRLRLSVGKILAADRSLGGLCDDLRGEAPQPADLVLDGSDPLKAATIRILLSYGSPDPLG